MAARLAAMVALHSRWGRRWEASWQGFDLDEKEWDVTFHAQHSPVIHRSHFEPGPTLVCVSVPIRV